MKKIANQIEKYNKLKQKLNLKKEKNKGITLIALVITIIVLLILAGVSIGMLTGQNGILTQAQNAKTATEQANMEEKLKVALMSLKVNKETEIGEFCDQLKEIGIEYEETEKFPVMATIKNSKYMITKEGNIIKRDLIKYESNGLMVYLDGNHNTYDSNSNSTSIWCDLSGHENNAKLNNFKFDSTSGWIENGLKIHGNTQNDITSNEEVIIPYKLEENESFSIEMVFERNGNERITYLMANTIWKTFVFHDWFNEKGIYDGRIYIGGNYAYNYNENNRFTPKDISYCLAKDKPQYVAYTYNSENNTATVYINGTENYYSKKYDVNNEACEFFQIKALESKGRIHFRFSHISSDKIL